MPKCLFEFIRPSYEQKTAMKINKLIKFFLLVSIDISAVFISILIMNIIRQDTLSGLFSIACFFFLALSAVFSNLLCRCYQCLWKYSGLPDALRQCFSSILNFIVLSVFIIIDNKLLKSDTFSFLTLTDAGLCVFIQFHFMVLFRFSYRIVNVLYTYLTRRFDKGAKTKVIVFCKLDDCRAILERKMAYKNKKISAVIIATPLNEKCNRVNGRRICTGDIDALKTAIKKYSADEIVISKDILDKDEMIRIYKMCYANKCLVKIYVGITEVPNGVRDIHLEDLLGRKQTVLDMERIKGYVSSKTILVTGGAGSIGSELCRQVLDFECQRLIILDINENGLFELDNELKRKFDTARYEIVVGSVQDNGCLEHVFNKYPVNIIFHAAAHKHVPLMESNPSAAIKNNVFGTLNVSNCAIKFGAENLILISTDKAVNCTSNMGATKRIAEIMVQMLNHYSPFTKLAAVRFGNVFGSNGSVIPTFQNQIKKGGPVTVTHPEVERYFMTMMEAVELVLQACYMAEGGEIFVLDMGKPVKILDLANDMIRLAGLEPGKDIEVEFTGLRPGEKMSEELTLQNETLRKTEIDKISICSPIDLSPDFLQKMKRLESIIGMEEDIDYKALLNELLESACY